MSKNKKTTGKWSATAKVLDSRTNSVIGNAEFVFELKNRLKYAYRHMKELAKIAALDAANEYNSKHVHYCLIDLRTVKGVPADTPLNYFPKSDYLEISIMTK